MLSLIRMPQMGVSDESAILTKWLVREGDRIRTGQPVFSLETDKATFQYEAESDSVLVRILIGEGEEVAVGSPVGILSDAEAGFSKSELAAFLNELDTTEKNGQVRTEAKKDGPHAERHEFAKGRLSPQNTSSPARRISPRARKTADERGVDLNVIRSGSGPGGRIIERDVLNASCIAPGNGFPLKSEGIYPGRPLSSDNRVNVRRIAGDETGRAGLVSRPVDARGILLKCNAGNGFSPASVICCELAKLLAGTPEMNARRHNNHIYEYNTVHLRLNVKTPAGVLKPVIRCAEAYSPDELAVLMRNAADRCRDYASKPYEFQDGTFAVADLSGYGIDFFTPDLTPPELCSLGIGAVFSQTRSGRRGGTEVYPAIRLTLVYDLAAIDAFRAAEFLNRLALRLEPDGAYQ